MTEDRIALDAPTGKASDADFLRSMIGIAAERLTALAVDGLRGAAGPFGRPPGAMPRP